MTETIKVRVLSRVKREGTYHSAGTEIVMPRKEYEDRAAAEAKDATLTHLYVPVDEYVQQVAQRQEAQATQAGVGNKAHAERKANFSEAIRVQQEAAALKTQQDAKAAQELAEAAQQRAEQNPNAAKPRRRAAQAAE